MASARAMRSAARNDLVDEADAIGLLGADHVAGQDELQGAALADQPRQTLRSAAARDEARASTSGWPNFAVSTASRIVHAIASLAAAAERKAIDGRDHRLAEVLDEVEDVLPERGLILGFDAVVWRAR